MMIGGFMLRGGATGSDVMIRARGPSLTQAAVQNTIANPRNGSAAETRGCHV